MKSTIKVALSYENKPMIKIYFEGSDDLRDEVLEQFIQKLVDNTGELEYFVSGRGENKSYIEIGVK